MAAIDFEDLVATMKGSGIGQEAMDLRALHAHLSQTLFLPPAQAQSGQPTPQSSYYNQPGPPPSSLNNSIASTSYNINNPTSYHPSSFKSDYDGSLSRSNYDAGGAGSRGPIPERGFPQSHHPSSYASSPAAGTSSSQYSNYFPAPNPPPSSAAFESVAPPADSPFGRQTRSQTRASANSAASQQYQQQQAQQQQYNQAFPGMDFQSGHGPGAAGANGNRSWAPPPTPRSLSLVRGGGAGGDDVEMGA